MTASAAQAILACRKCGRVESTYHAQCAGCGAFNTIGPRTSGSVAPREIVATATRIFSEPPQASQAPIVAQPAYQPPVTEPVAITDVIGGDDEPRTTCGLEPLDRVLGGGVVDGSVILIGGEPGGGKTTMLLQAAIGIGGVVLYATGEESIKQVAMTARRIGAAQERLKLIAETDIDRILTHATRLRPTMIVIDSIQTMATRACDSAPGSVLQVKECALRVTTFCKREGIAAIIVAHVTKDSTIAGPKTMSHLVDVVMSFQVGDVELGLGHVRFLRASKNRFGPTQAIGSLEMTSKGLVPCDASPTDTQEDRDEIYQPLAQELLNRYLAGGGNVDDGLRERIGELLDLDMWRETR